jgi:hypothetical protein
VEVNNIIDVYDYLKKYPVIWTSSAQQLKRAAELIALQIDEDSTTAKRFDDSRTRRYDMPVPLWGVDVYLIGVAIENLLKGILQEKGRSFEQVMGFNHRLVDLYDECCGACGLTPQLNEREMLDILAEFVLWAGRYALPTSSKQLKGRRWILQNTPYGPLMLLTVPNSEVLAFSDTERVLINSIYERFFNYLAMGYIPKQTKLLHPKQYLLPG